MDGWMERVKRRRRKQKDRVMGGGMETCRLEERGVEDGGKKENRTEDAAETNKQNKPTKPKH